MQLLRFLLLLAFYGLLLPGKAQEAPPCNFRIEGTILDQTSGEALPFVRVQIEGTTQGTLADDTGHFELKGLCKKEYDLVFTYIGYKTLRHHHDFHHEGLTILMVPDTITLEGIVVEAERTGNALQTMTVERLTGAELAWVQSESLGDVAAQITGVSTIQTGQNVVKPVIHGLHSNRILIINHGLRHEFQNWGSEHAPEIDPSMAASVEVVKGAGTVRYGPEALGGVLLIHPPRMELLTPFKGKIQATGKSNGRSGESQLQLSKGFKWLSLMGEASYLKQGDLSSPDYSLTNTGKTETGYAGGIRIHPFAELDIEAYYSHFEQDLGILSGSVFGNLEDLQRAMESDIPLYTEDFSYEIKAPKQDIQHDLLKLKAQYVGEHQALSIQYGYQINHRKEFGVRRGDAPNIDLELRTESLDLDWHLPQWGGLTSQLGFQWQKQANDNLPGTNTVPFIPNYDSDEYGIYLIESFQTGQHVFEAGLRYDQLEARITGREPDNTIYRNRLDYRNVSGTLGWQFQLQPQVTYRSNLGTAWRAPNIAELYRFGQHSFFIEYGLWRYTIDERFDIVSTREGILDENDRPVPAEKGYKWLHTLEWYNSTVQAEVTAYLNFIEHYIYAKPAGITRTPRGYFVYFIYDQTDALLWGLDLTVKWQHQHHLSSELRANYLWARQLDPKDFFAALPPPRIQYTLQFQPDTWKKVENHFQLSLEYTFSQPQHPRIISVEEFLYAAQNDINRFVEDASDFDLLAPPQGFFLAHLAWRGQWKHLEWQFQVKNLFNTSYRSYTDRLRYFADDLGRNFILGLGYKI